MAEQAAALAADESDFTTSSVDQFLRDHGFDIADHAGLELSSLSDDDDDGDASDLSEQLQQQAHAGDDEGATRTPSRLHVVTNVSPNDDDAKEEEKEIADDAPPRRSERHRRRSLFDAQSASEEEEPVTPHFTLLNDKDLLLVQGEQTASASAVTPIVEMQADDSHHAHEGQGHNDDEDGHDSDGRDSLDRSMVLGVGSGFSGFSSSEVDERSRIAQILHEKGASPVVSIQRSREQQQRRSNSLSSSPSIIPGSSVDSLASGSRRVRDDELSDALGVTSSTPEQDPSIITRATISSRLSRASVHQRRATFTTNRPSAVRASQRALFATEDEERKESENVGTRESFQSNQQQRPSVTLSEPYIQQGSIASRADESRVRASSVPSADDGGWGDLNDKLRKHGLQVITFERIHAAGGIAMTVPNRASVFDCVQDVVLQLERKDQIIQDLILESNRNSREQSRAEGDLQSVEKKNDEIRSALESAKAEVVRLQEKLKQGKDEADEQSKKLKQSCLKLQQQLKVSEHRVKAKEVLMDRMQQKLQQQVDKENLSKTRDHQVFRQIQQRDVKKTNPRDSRSLEYISVFETQREQMQEEIDHLKNQVTALNAELRDKENYIARKSSTSVRREMATWDDGDAEYEDENPVIGRRKRSQAPPSVVSDDMMLERLEAARREQEQAAAKLRRREAAMIKKVSMIEQELLIAHETIAELKEENANLTLEAESRPSIRDYRLCQRRIHQLERQVSESKLALEEATDLNELRKYMGTKELIERDRLNHRLHLNRLNTLPRETTLEVVKEVCRVLNLTDITLITPSLEKLCRVVAAVPRMERFIRDVCGFVFLNVGDTNEDGKSGFELEQVLPTLQQWTAERRKLHALEEFKVSIMSELCKRSIEPSVLPSEEHASAQSQPSSLSRAVHIVSELVALEKNVLHHREIYSQAATELERRPSVLVNQIVRHFSHLFQVKSVEGVLPKINVRTTQLSCFVNRPLGVGPFAYTDIVLLSMQEIYLFVNEMENFLNVVRGLVNLKKQASVTVCLNVVREKLESDGLSLRPPVHEQHENRDPNENFEPNFVVEKNAKAAAVLGGGDLTGVRQVREMTILIRDLKRELGAASMHEILPRTKRLMELLSLSIHNNSFDDED